MKSKRILIAFGLVLSLVVLGIVFRNFQLDAATSAMKARDYSVAVTKLTPLAHLGDRQAQYLLGQMYAFGWGVAKDDEQAIQWFRKAAMWSDGAADPAAPAEYYVGRSYREGQGVVANEAEAAKWLQRAAQGGYVVP